MKINQKNKSIMNRTILYYPTINIPNSSWLRHALLYWDEVSSIIPKNWNNELAIELSPELQYLIEEGQFRPISPDDIIIKQRTHNIINDFEREFQEIVDSESFQNFVLSSSGGSVSNGVFQGIHLNKFSRIHYHKVGIFIHNFLENKGLAKRSEDYHWLLFENNTALLYMALLAKYLANVDSSQTIISTDNQYYEAFNFKRVSKEQGFPVISVSLDNFLPTPKDNVPLEAIISFKRRRADNLTHFKKTISDFQNRISNSKSTAELKDLTATSKEALINGVKDLSLVLQESRIESYFKTFKSLINTKSPTLLTAVGGLLNDKFDIVDLPVNWAPIGIAAMGAIEITGLFIEARNKERIRVRESAFSYLYHAHKAGLIENPSI